MSKIQMSSDERYPVYFVVPNGDYEVEATAAQIKRWTRAKEAFDAAQDEMAELYQATANIEIAKAKAEREAAEAAERAKRDAAAKARAAIAREREKQRDKAVKHIEETGGDIYDARGRKVGTVTNEGTMITLGSEPSS